MILIKIFSSFGDPKKATEAYIRLCEMYFDPDFLKKYSWTEREDYTHAIILNTAMPTLKISKSCVLGLAFEPIEYLGLTPQFINYAKTHIGKYYVGNASGLPEPFTEHFSFMWHTPRKPISKKTKLASIIFSQKTQAPGHIYRINLIEKILKSTLPIDIYGYGCQMLKVKDDRIKGSFNGTEPLDDYKYHICVENYRHPCYISEKFMDPVLCGCIPIYLGAYKVESLFPNSCIPLSGDLGKDWERIKDVLDTNPEDKKPVYPESLKLNNHLKNIFNL